MISQSLERKKFLEKCTRNHSINAKLAANEINGAPGQSRTGDLRFRKRNEGFQTFKNQFVKKLLPCIFLGGNVLP